MNMSMHTHFCKSLSLNLLIEICLSAAQNKTEAQWAKTNDRILLYSWFMEIKNTKNNIEVWSLTFLSTCMVIHASEYPA